MGKVALGIQGGGANNAITIYTVTLPGLSMLRHPALSAIQLFLSSLDWSHPCLNAILLLCSPKELGSSRRGSGVVRQQEKKAFTCSLGLVSGRAEYELEAQPAAGRPRAHPKGSVDAFGNHSAGADEERGGAFLALYSCHPIFLKKYDLYL